MFSISCFDSGYHRLHEFVLTQHPLESTIGDFWQLLWDHNVQMVVLLSLVDDQDYPTFWPVHNEDLDLDTFRVKLTQESDRVGYVVRDFTIQSLQDDYELSVKMVQSSHWPYHCSSNSTNIFDLVQVVQKATSETYNGSVVVIDRYSSTQFSASLHELQENYSTFARIDLVALKEPHFVL